jgi:hypothetical protein
MSDLPARPDANRRLDRSALERVLARAAELQSATGEVPEELTDAQVVELGKEVGLSPANIRQAIAEERTRVAVPPAPGQLGGMYGPERLTSSRTVRGRAAEVLASVDRWMQREECLQVRRRFEERMTWEPRRDLVGSLRRGFNVGGRGYALSRADVVGATVVAVDETRSLVRLEAEIAAPRRRAIGASAASAGLGAAAGIGVVGIAVATGGAALVAGAIGAAVLGVGAAAGIGFAQAQRSLATRVQLALDQLLDRLEHGPLDERPGSLLNVLLGPRP